MHVVNGQRDAVWRWPCTSRTLFQAPEHLRSNVQSDKSVQSPLSEATGDDSSKCIQGEKAFEMSTSDPMEKIPFWHAMRGSKQYIVVISRPVFEIEGRARGGMVGCVLSLQTAKRKSCAGVGKPRQQHAACENGV